MTTKLISFSKILLFGLAVLLYSCSDDEKDPASNNPDLTVIEDDFEINAAYEDLDNLTIQAVQSLGMGLRVDINQESTPCGAIYHQEESKTITIDFGPGCTDSKNITRKGKVILKYSTSTILIPGANILTTFDGYEVNGLKLEGERTLVNSGVNLITFELTLTVKVKDGKITWPDNTFATYETDQVRILKMGANGYDASVTGTASGKSRSGIDYTAQTTAPLKVTQTCTSQGIWLPSQGKLGFSFQGFLVTADYGSGACDRKVMLTWPGGEKEVTVD